jgi:predicted kinase
MRRLSDDDRADLRLLRGALSDADVDSVAEYLALFHSRMPASEIIAEFGSPERILANVRENFTQTRGLIEPLLGAERAREIEAQQTRFFEVHRELLLERVRKGNIRDGHGDLRLEHVYLREGDAPKVIDCIEFNERFRYADTCADIAFLSMDFERFGRADLAERFLAAYARASSDYDLYALIDAYEGYRAYVRGKVAAFLSEDGGASHEVREKARVDARQAFLLALSKGRPALLSPAVVAVGGIIASGKSTAAARIAGLMNAPVVDADRTRKALLGVPETAKLHDDAFCGAYSQGATDRVYEEIFRRASCVLASGRPVILDASFRSRALREGARSLATRYGVPFFFVECRVGREETERRLEKRAQSPCVSDGRREVLDAFVAQWEPTEELASAEHVVLDTSRPVEATMEELNRRLPAWPAGLVG